MKGYLSLLFGSLFLAVMFLIPGNNAEAATPVSEPAQVSETDHCGCEVTILTGAERNKIAAQLNSSNVFKDVKKDLMNQGYKWKGSGATEIIINHTHGDIVLVGAKFTGMDGKDYAFGFLYMNDEFLPMGLAPDEK